jgi:hypothetical protein
MLAPTNSVLAPVRIALKIGAPRLLVLSIVWTVLVSAGIVVAALSVGLRQ